MKIVLQILVLWSLCGPLVMGLIIKTVEWLNSKNPQFVITNRIGYTAIFIAGPLFWFLILLLGR